MTLIVLTDTAENGGATVYGNVDLETYEIFWTVMTMMSGGTFNE